MSLRKIFFWMHLIAGSIGGVVILSMSFTGVLLTYERQILARVERGPFRADAPSPGVRRLAVEELLQKAGEPPGGLPAEATLTLRRDPREPAELAVGREGALYVDPYTGRVLGRPSGEWRSFFQKITSWHRWLGAEGEGRTVAKAITGACNLAFLFLVLSGFYLWLPKKWSRQYLAPVTWFRGGISGKARDFNWHNVFGLWSAVPLFFVVLTAVPMSYTWANDLIYRLTGSEQVPLRPPFGKAGPKAGAKGGFRKGGERPSPPGAPGMGGGEARAASPLDLAGLNQLWERAEASTPGWQSIGMRLPESARRPVMFTIDTGDGGQPQKRSTLTLDRATGSVVRHETFASNNAGRRLRSWARFVHTGEAFGITGQTLAGIASFAGVMLVWTGISLALRRLAGWNRRRRQHRTEEAAVAVAATVSEP